MEFYTYMLPVFLFSFNIYNIYGEEDVRDVAVDTRSLSKSNLHTILNELKRYGPTKKPKDQAAGADQYTCVTVLAEDEIQDISWLNYAFPDTFTKDDRRIRVQYNENNNKDHGEKLLLERYLDKLIAEMQKDSREKKFNIYPIVVLYSFYIPCSMTNHVCAKRLADDKKSRKPTYSLILGYSGYYVYQQRHKNHKELTINNIKTSFKTLQEGAIQVYYMIRDFSNELSTIYLRNDVSDIFQTNLYDCLMNQPLAYCCSANLDETPEEAVDGVKRIVSFSINSLIYSCSEHVTRTRALVLKLTKCFDNWLDANIGQDCQTCASGTFGRELLLRYTKLCTKQASQFSTYVGGLSNRYRLDDPSWNVNAPLDWSYSPAAFTINNAIYCYNRNLRPDTFCTKTQTMDEERVSEATLDVRPRPMKRYKHE